MGTGKICKIYCFLKICVVPEKIITYPRNTYFDKLKLFKICFTLFLFSGDNIAYIYTDMKTALVGKFEKGLMVSCYFKLAFLM